MALGDPQRPWWQPATLAEDQAATLGSSPVDTTVQRHTVSVDGKPAVVVTSQATAAQATAATTAAVKTVPATMPGKGKVTVTSTPAAPAPTKKK